MLDTVKIKNRKNTKIIAHRGLSGIELENTNSAFVAAANRSYFGIEADVHITADGKFVIFHDDTTGRLADEDLWVEKSTFETLRTLSLKPSAADSFRTDLKIPTLDEYISICKKYGKTAVLELKNKMSAKNIHGIVKAIKKHGYLDKMIFISFSTDNIEVLRRDFPTLSVQYLTTKFNDTVLKTLKRLNVDLDIVYSKVNKQIIDVCHKNGIKVNCWTVDNIGDAERLIDYGIDYISTNILE